MHMFWPIELCAHDTGLARVMRGQSLNRSFDYAQDYRNNDQCARRMQFQFVSKKEAHAEKSCWISGILGWILVWPNKTLSDAAGVLVGGWVCAHRAQVGEGTALSARRTPTPAATASVPVGGEGGPHGGQPGWAARPRHSRQPGGAARPQHGGQPGRAARPRGVQPGWAAPSGTAGSLVGWPAATPAPTPEAPPTETAGEPETEQTADVLPAVTSEALPGLAAEEIPAGTEDPALTRPPSGWQGPRVQGSEKPDPTAPDDLLPVPMSAGGTPTPSPPPPPPPPTAAAVAGTSCTAPQAAAPPSPPPKPTAACGGRSRRTCARPTRRQTRRPPRRPPRPSRRGSPGGRRGAAGRARRPRDTATVATAAARRRAATLSPCRASSCRPCRRPLAARRHGQQRRRRRRHRL